MRGSGTTTQQLKAALPGSLFIYCTRDTSYPKGILKRLERTDVTVRGIDALERVDTMTAQRYTDIVVDHAAPDTPNNHRAFRVLLSLCQKSNFDRIDLHEMIARSLESR